MTLPLSAPPKSICLLRLSAIGDVTHVLPIVRSLQYYWPETKITWIIGRLEYQLVEGLEGVEFIVFDKAKGISAYRDVWQQLKDRHFNVLLHMQVSLRASLVSLTVRAPIRLGYDKVRAKDKQWLFCNHRIAAVERQHVLDGFFEFLTALGLHERHLRWGLPIPDQAKQWAAHYVDQRPMLIINPSSSQRLRNWRTLDPACYADVILYAVERYRMKVILTGGPAANESALAEAILQQPALQDLPQALAAVTNLVGKTGLKQLAALMANATTVIAPDTGPAHIANAVGVPVIGLYVTSNPERTGPYNSLNTVVNQYPQAVEKYLGERVENLPWGKRVRDPEALALITAGKINEKLDQVMKA